MKADLIKFGHSIATRMNGSCMIDHVGFFKNQFQRLMKFFFLFSFLLLLRWNGLFSKNFGEEVQLYKFLGEGDGMACILRCHFGFKYMKIEDDDERKDCARAGSRLKIVKNLSKDHENTKSKDHETTS